MLILTMSMAFMIASILSVLGWFMGNKQKQTKEKLSPFECGFDNNPTYRFPLSLRFFIITVLFLLFDMEIVLLLPLPLSLSFMPLYPVIYLTTIFVILLALGIYFEWQQGSLEWN